MLKFQKAAKFTASLTTLAVFLGLSSPLAFGLIPPQSAKQSIVSLKNWGLENSESASHINARKAWRISKGSKKIVVAVIDTGIDAIHPDLKDNICRRRGSDEYGFDFVTGKKNPGDAH
ncbi:MAG: S8 family serine peptidase, partial [Bdellovibrionota bacterium]